MCWLTNKKVLEENETLSDRATSQPRTRKDYENNN